MKRTIVIAAISLAVLPTLSAFAESPGIAEPPKLRTDLCISGVYPHLTTYGIYSQNGAHFADGHNECGIGAIVPWAGKLWMVNYAPHMPRGSQHKLFSIDPDLNRPLTIHPESVGGTPAGRMIHAESQQLLIGHYLIDAQGNVRVISPSDMPIRVTAIARHLTDPVNRVYYVDMEGSIWEADVHTLAIKRLFEKPVPGWHGKGGYTSQGRLVVSNNGELRVGNYDDLLVGGPAHSAEERGVLAEWDGQQWRIVERRQYTEVTGPRGIAGGSEGDDPIWAVGWDRRSLRLKLLENGRWHTFLLPKAAYCNDASHGWYTEWPRIREITGGRWMMDMHGMFFDFPPTFSARDSAGIRPIGSHLRYIPDFCAWNDKLVLATDETSIQENPLAGQPQSNLWFGRYEELQEWGPANGYGGPWVEDEVAAGQPSSPFLVAGFDRRVLHLALGRRSHSMANPGERHPSENSSAAKRRDDQTPQVRLTLQVDQHGNDQWADWKTISLEPNGHVSYIFPADFEATWLRIVADSDCVATAFLHQTSNRFPDGQEPGNQSLFAGLANLDDTHVRGGWVYASKHNRNLRLLAADHRDMEFTKAAFDFQPVEADETSNKLKDLLRVRPIYTVDEASVVVRQGEQTWRLPKGDDAYDAPFVSGWPRDIREVESERKLANIHGTFYEVPLVTNGAPPAWNRVRPISSHQKQITDYCSWNGLLVLAGVRADAQADGHIFSDEKSNCAVWLGGVDDLWKLGKPVGRGGPWFSTQVTAGDCSDPYLMTGYDQKSVHLSHGSTQPRTIRLEVDVTGDGLWLPYQTFVVPPAVTVNHEFPSGFSACWVRALSEQAAKVTVWFEYR
ncbi:MAG: hypothetical protein KDA60_05115 [Planctomycetales bacterium]|nr:hypothetical protein [Planctomycetales bacterium]